MFSVGLVGWVGALKRQFGWRLLVLIFVLMHLLNGFVRNLVGPAGALPYLFRSYGLDASTVLMFQSVLRSMWVMAPLIALATDFFPVAGYKNAPSIMITSLLGTFGCLMIVMVPDMPARAVLVFMALLQFQQVAATVCCTGTVVRRLQGQEELGPDLQTFVAFGIEAGGLVGNLATGAVVEGFGPRAAWGLAALPAAAVGSLAASGFFEERHIDREQLARTRQHIREQWEVTFLALLLFACTLFANVLTVRSASIEVNLVSYVVGAAIVLFCFATTLSPPIAKVAVFSILVNAASMNIDSALFYFLTDPSNMYQDGPHLSVVFFNGVRGPVYGVFALVGILTYQKYMKASSYRRVIMFSNIASSASVLSTLIIVTRLNVRLGIPDTVFILVHAAFRAMTQQWCRMPFRVLFMYLCPIGMEATVSALLKGISDLGNSASDSLGAGLLSSLGCTPNGSFGEAASFRSIHLAIIITAVVNMGVAVAMLPLIPAGAPNRRLVGDYADATTGSVMSTWLNSMHVDSAKALAAKGGAAAVLLEDGRLPASPADKCSVRID